VVKVTVDSKRRSPRYLNTNANANTGFSSSNTNSRRSSPSTREWEGRNVHGQWNKKDEPIVSTKFVPRSIATSEVLNTGRPVNASADSWASAPYRANDPRSRLDESDLLRSKGTNKENMDSRRKSDWNQAKPTYEVSRSVDISDGRYQRSSFDEPGNNTSRPKTSDWKPAWSDRYNDSQPPSRQPSQSRHVPVEEDVDDLYSTYPQTISKPASRRPSIATNNYDDDDDERDSNYFNSKYSTNSANQSANNVDMSNENLFYEKSKGQYVISSPQGAGTHHSSVGSGLPRVFNGKHSFVQVAHAMDVATEHVQCVIVRNRSMASSLNPLSTVCYELILEDNKKSLIMAQKKTLNRTSNYHLFDMTRGHAGGKFSKKSGNFIGELILEAS
jgi:hypothetical protein